MTLGAVWPPQGGLLLVKPVSHFVLSQEQPRSSCSCWTFPQDLPLPHVSRRLHWLWAHAATQCSSNATHTAQRTALSGQASCRSQQHSGHTHAPTSQPPTSPIKTLVTPSNRHATPHSPNPASNKSTLQSLLQRSCSKRKQRGSLQICPVLLAAQACQQESGAGLG